MVEDNQQYSTAAAPEQWEYLYLSRREWRERVIAKCGYRWKLLLTPAARQRFQQDQETAIESVLNELGREGWELVGLLPATLVLLGSGGSIGCDAIFKRQRARPDQADMTAFQKPGSLQAARER
jgi:hypothetical protein